MQSRTERNIIEAGVKPGEIILAAINTGNFRVKCAMGQAQEHPKVWSDLSAVCRNGHHVDLGENTNLQQYFMNTKMLFGQDAVQSGALIIPKLQANVRDIYFQRDAPLRLTPEMETRIWGPIADGLRQLYLGKEQYNLIVGLCVAPKDHHLREELKHVMEGMKLLAIGNQTMKVNVLKCLVPTETHAGIESQQLRFVAPNQPLWQDMETLKQEKKKIAVNCGARTTDVTPFGVRINQIKQTRQFVSMSGGLSRDYGHWTIFQNGLRDALVKKFSSRIGHLSDWEMLKVLETKQLPGSPAVDISEFVLPFYAEQAKSIIEMIDTVREKHPDASELVLFGGGMHDYANDIINAPKLQSIAKRYVARTWDDVNDKPEDAVNYGIYMLLRMWYDRQYAR